MKQIVRIGSAAMPAFGYFFGSNLLFMLMKYFGKVMGWRAGSLFFQFLAQAGCFVVLAIYFKSRPLGIETKQAAGTYRFPAYFCYIVSALGFSIFGNQAIAWLRSYIPQFSAGYGHVEQMFYGNELLLEVAALGILGPLVEEMVYRGIVLVRLYQYYPPAESIAISAFFFGLFHWNLVQGTYAACMGILFGFLYWKTGHIFVPMAAHMAANLFAVLQTETGLFSFLQAGLPQGAMLQAIVCFFLSVFFLQNGNRLHALAAKNS